MAEVATMFVGKKDIRIKRSHSLLKELKEDIQGTEVPFLGIQDFYLQHNGKVLSTDAAVKTAFSGFSQGDEIGLSIIPRLVGGKGGFGSMLRAIGAQIEKTTNRDACRDLSGRRLRDINEEERIRKYWDKQAEREKEREEVRAKKLEKLRKFAEGQDTPKITDQDFIQKSEEINEAVYDAVEEAFRDGNNIDALAAAGSDDSSQGASAKPEASQSSSGPSKTSSEPGTSSTAAASASQNEKSKRTNMRRTMFDEDLSTDSSDEEDSNEVCKISN